MAVKKSIDDIWKEINRKPAPRHGVGGLPAVKAVVPPTGSNAAQEQGLAQVPPVPFSDLPPRLPLTACRLDDVRAEEYLVRAGWTLRIYIPNTFPVRQALTAD